MINAAEISETKGGNLIIVSIVASDHGELGWRFGGLRRSPNDIRGLYRGMGEVIDAGELGDIKDKTTVAELAHFVCVQISGVETTP